MTDTLCKSEAALSEMDYRHTESIVGETTSVSIPCQLRFTESPDQDTTRFHEALQDRGFESLDVNPDRDGTGTHYDGKICSKEHYNRMRVLVFRADLVRLYPHDDYVPAAEELAEVIEAIEIGFDAELKHDPIEE